MKIFEPFLVLMESGGNVLWVLFFVAFVLIALIVERAHFYKKDFSKYFDELLSEAQKVKGADWRALYQRDYYVSRLKVLLNQRLSLIQVITYMCPLFGLLGTVTGMIAVFDVMANKGLGNPRLMASGVSQATLPTMVSMILALVGLVGLNYLKSQKTKMELEITEKFQVEPSEG